MANLWDAICKVPPVTRFLCASTLAVTLPVILEALSPNKLVFVKASLLQNLEIWRLFTSLFYAGGGLMFIFNFAMLCRYSYSLESSYYKDQSADLAWQVMINCWAIVALNLPLNSLFHFRPLLLSLIAVISRLEPDSFVSLFGLATFSNIYFPYVLIALYLIIEGPSAGASALTGLISGYSWWYIVHSEEASPLGSRFSAAPAWMQRALAERHNWGRGQRLGSSV